MNPYWQQINETSLQPYLQGDLPYEEAVVQAQNRSGFMFRQTKERIWPLL